MIHVKCERPEMVNRKWQNQQEIGLCLQLCCWSPLGSYLTWHISTAPGEQGHGNANTQTHTKTYIIRVIHFILHIPAAFWKKDTPFQILKGDMFLIIDIQVRISILCCLTLQTWVAVGWERRRKGWGFSGTKSLVRRQRNELGKWKCSDSDAVQEASQYHPTLPSPKSQEGRGGIDETSRKA